MEGDEIREDDMEVDEDGEDEDEEFVASGELRQVRSSLMRSYL